ncbi:MAG TPA: hypothetical protein VFT99_15650 [Roseiflexaceae bacterium]|nr:hypothetical protein [Roseiflexaceae bacterium]
MDEWLYDDNRTVGGLVRAVLADPLQCGMLIGVCAGALLAAFAGARRPAALSAPSHGAGVTLAPNDDSSIERAVETADVVVERVLSRHEDLTKL